MRWWEPVPFTQCADVHQADRFISVEPLSGYRNFYPESESHVAYLEPEANDERLALALWGALRESRFISPIDEPAFFKADRYVKSHRDWQKDFMRRYRYKTKREAYENLKWCRVERSEGRIRIRPHDRDKPGYFRHLPEDQDVGVSAITGAAALGAALRLALDRCK
jgi:hypothetical protein